MERGFLIFSDLHITPKGYNTAILKEIARMIQVKKPAYIVCTGDLGDFSSQNKLVKDRGSFSVAEELTSVVNCIECYIVNTVKTMQKKQRRDKKKIYKPRIVFCLGNHDAPVAFALTRMLQDIGIEVIQHRDSIVIDGIVFSHTFDNGISSYPCTSTTQILQTTLMRSVSGHSHVRSITEQRDAEGYKMFAIKMPCATLAEPEWAGQGVSKWDRGYLYLTIDTATDWYSYQFKEYRK